MRIDDIQWAYNGTTDLYEVYAYSTEHGAERVVALEFKPMQLMQVARKLAQTVQRDFPPHNPALDVPPVPAAGSGPQPVFTPASDALDGGVKS